MGATVSNCGMTREERAAESRAYMARYAPGPGYVWNVNTGQFDKEISPSTASYWMHVCNPTSPWPTQTYFIYRLPGGGSFKKAFPPKSAGDASTR